MQGKKKKIWKHTRNYEKYFNSYQSRGSIFLTHLISVPVALNSDYRPQACGYDTVWGHISAEGWEWEFPLWRSHVRPRGGWVGPAWRGTNAQRCLQKANAMGSSLAAPSVTAAMGSARLSHNCTISTLPASLPACRTPLRSPAWQPSAWRMFLLTTFIFESHYCDLQAGP